MCLPPHVMPLSSSYHRHFLTLFSPFPRPFRVVSARVLSVFPPCASSSCPPRVLCDLAWTSRALLTALVSSVAAFKKMVSTATPSRPSKRPLEAVSSSRRETHGIERVARGCTCTCRRRGSYKSTTSMRRCMGTSPRGWDTDRGGAQHSFGGKNGLVKVFSVLVLVFL